MQGIFFMIKMTLKLLPKVSYLVGEVFGYRKTIFQDNVCLYSKSKSSIGFHKTETLNAHNFLIVGGFEKF